MLSRALLDGHSAVMLTDACFRRGAPGLLALADAQCLAKGIHPSLRKHLATQMLQHVGDYNNPGPIRLVFHDPSLAIFSSHSKKP